MDNRHRWTLKRVVPIGAEEETYTLIEGRNLIGRATNSRIKCGNVQVSRVHCELTLQNNEVILMDNNSFNGTFLNDTKLPPLRKLFVHPGDKIGLGMRAQDFNEAYVFELVREDPFLTPLTEQRSNSPSQGLKRKRPLSLEVPNNCHPPKSTRLSGDVSVVSKSFGTNMVVSKPLFSSPPLVDLTHESNEETPAPPPTSLLIDLTTSESNEEPLQSASMELTEEETSNASTLANVTLRRRKEPTNTALNLPTKENVPLPSPAHVTRCENNELPPNQGAMLPNQGVFLVGSSDKKQLSPPLNSSDKPFEPIGESPKSSKPPSSKLSHDKNDKLLTNSCNDHIDVVIKQEPLSPKLLPAMSFSLNDEIIILSDSDSEEPSSQLFSPNHKFIKALPVEEDIEVDILNDENVDEIVDEGECSLFEEHFSQCSQQIFQAEDTRLLGRKSPLVQGEEAPLDKEHEPWAVPELPGQSEKEQEKPKSITEPKKEKETSSRSTVKPKIVVGKSPSTEESKETPRRGSTENKMLHECEPSSSCPKGTVKPTEEIKEGKQLKVCEALPLQTKQPIKKTRNKKGDKKDTGSRSTRSSKSLVETTLFGKSDKKKIIEERKEKLKSLAAKKKESDLKSDKTSKAPPATCAKVTEKNRGLFLTENDATKQVNNHGTLPVTLPNIKIKKIQKESVSAPREISQQPSGEESDDISSKTNDQTGHKKMMNGLLKKGYLSKGTRVSSEKKSLQKKTVTFVPGDKLCEVRLYPCEGKLKKINDSKDSRVLPKTSSLVSAVPHFRGTLPMSNDILFDICHWNTSWIEESKVVQTGDPPLYPPCNGLLYVRNEYQSFSDYHTTFYPHLLSELWNSILQDLTHQDQYGFITYNGAIDTVQIIPLKSANSAISSKGFIQANGAVTYRREDAMKSRTPVLGDFVLVNCKTHLHNNKSVVFSAFGYMTSTSKPTKIDNLRSNTIDHAQFRKGSTEENLLPDSCFNFSLLICNSSKKVVHPGTRIIFRVIRNLNKDLRELTAIRTNVPGSPLAQLIYNPRLFISSTLNPSLKLISEFPLDEAQKEAVLNVSQCILSKRPSINLIHGPPGAGKSHVIISLIMQILYSERKKSFRSKPRPKILLCAPSNTAVDQIALRLLNIRQQMPPNERFNLVRHGRRDAMHPTVRDISVETLAERDVRRFFKDPYYTQLNLSLYKAEQRALATILEKPNCGSGLPHKYLEMQANTTRKIEDLEHIRRQGSQSGIDFTTAVVKRQVKDLEDNVFQCADIIATTLASSSSPSMTNAFAFQKDCRFSCCIIDEATQATEPESLMPLALKIDKFVLVGDPQQLPPTVISKACKEKGFTKSLFSRFSTVYESFTTSPLYFLNTQYRMHPDIAAWPSKQFYQNKLNTSPSLNVSYPFHPYLIFQHTSKQDPNGESNKGEAEMIATLLKGILANPTFKDYSVGVIVPYQKQKQHFSQLFKNCGLIKRSIPIEINTIDSFQGQEKDIIVLSCVRTDGIGFLSDSQRLNVALTRAKKCLLVFANFSSLKNNLMWNDMFENARKRSLVVTVDASFTPDKFIDEIICNARPPPPTKRKSH